jgi:hypothetical protein
MKGENSMETAYILYLAGRLRGNWLRVILNRRKARQYAKLFWEAGFIVYSPHLNSGWLNHPKYDKFVMDANLRILKICDVVFVMPEWEKSIGTRREIATALQNNIRLYFNKETILNNLKTGVIKDNWNIDLEKLYRRIADKI